MRRMIVIASVGGLLIGGGVVVRQSVVGADRASRSAPRPAGEAAVFGSQPAPVQHNPPRNATPNAAPSPFGSESQFFPAGPEHAPGFVVSPLEQKRQHVVKLAGEYAGLLTEGELDEFLAEFEGTVNRKRAERDLQETRERLQSLIEKFPGTPAAERARQMLELKLQDEEPVEAAAESIDSDVQP